LLANQVVHVNHCPIKDGQRQILVEQLEKAGVRLDSTVEKSDEFDAQRLSKMVD